MKKITFLFLLLSLAAFAQKTINRDWAEQVKPIFENLEASRVPGKILLDMAMEFTDVTAYNGTVTDSTTIDAKVFSNIYKTLFMGRITTDTTYFPRMETYAYKWMQNRRSYNASGSNVIVLAGLVYNYGRISVNAIAQDKIIVDEGRLFEKYINDVWQNPYDSLTTVAFAAPVSHYGKLEMDVVVPKDLFISNIPAPQSLRLCGCVSWSPDQHI